MLRTEVKTCKSHSCWQAFAPVKAAWQLLEPYIPVNSTRVFTAFVRELYHRHAVAVAFVVTVVLSVTVVLVVAVSLV